MEERAKDIKDRLKSRRDLFKGRRCCSSSALYGFAEFSESFISEIKSKISDKVEEEPEAAESDEVQKEISELPSQSMVFSLDNRVEVMVAALKVFQDEDVKISRIESRKSQHRDSLHEIFIEIACDNTKMEGIVDSLQQQKITCISFDNFKNGEEILSDPPKIPRSMEFFRGMTWFPMTISDLDISSNRVLMYGSELDAAHPGFKDEVYRKRRNAFAKIAMNYRHGQPIPKMKYTEEETKTWGTVFRELQKLYPTHACKEYLENFELFVKHCDYREDNIPQLEDVSNFLKQRTGVTLRPVAGYLSSRDFLAGLAFRVFHCTQYIRHHSDPFYTPEPDCCHELLGHMPMLADPGFTQFSQEIGLTSLGASDEEVAKLATCYFFTIEFGLCKQNNEMRAYGAGLLSSIAELKHSLSPEAAIEPFNPENTIHQEPIITTFQDVYFFSESFDEAKERMREFATTIKRPFGVRYNPYTQGVELLCNTKQIANVMNDMKGDLCIISNALKKIQEQES